MKHVRALLMKFAMTAIGLEIVVYLFSDLAFTDILYMSAFITIISYVIGDLLILPSTNNTIATIADAVLALAIIYAFDSLWGTMTISLLDALMSAALIAIGEWFFHKYISVNVLEKGRE
ncbi:DUF2512 family protein [Clostridium cellulovorans]|uniref:Integral membrane protein n=1 Tax=Clostridium cellulovorans (strain ATCC 35296 / DSM 3052 / OCM 3 / 743B) TaxID=573061 RepID=D9SUC1_CLOC7|nr:DUF2512 family protein [Clostridium cellulovorans]ADL52876.1 Protein of unknown function DUF2512 [Clostridium cellulovorans 743B]